MSTNDAPTIELLLRHQSLVRTIARDLLTDPDAADDVVQQTWLAALRHAARGAEVGRSLLARIATNLAFNRRRDARRREAHEQRAAVAEPMPSVAELVEREDERRRVVDAVFALHEPLRETMLRRYLDDRTEDEVAAALGVPLGTVRTRLRRARALLRERLAGHGDAPRSARALVALAGWSADEAAAVIVSGKGVVFMGVKAWVAAAAGVAVVGMLAWTTVRSGEAVREETALAPTDREAPRVGSTVDSEGTPSTAGSQRSEATSVAREKATPLLVIHGRCVTPERVPIEGATVSSPRSSATTRSSIDGRFALTADLSNTEEIVVTAVSDGRARASQSFRAQKLDSIELGDFVLPMGASIRGIVLDESDRPVAATIELQRGTNTWIGWRFGQPTPPFLSQEGHTVTADASGRFAIPHVGENWYRLLAVHADFVSIEPLSVALRAGVDVDAVVRVRAVRDDERIRGRALAHDGTPIANAEVVQRFELVEGGGFSGGEHSRMTDALGTFAFIAVAGSTNTLTLRSDVGTIERKGVRGGDPDVVLHLDGAPSTIFVVEADDGTPCQYARVCATTVGSAGSRAGSTDERGAARIVLPAEPFELRVSCRGYDQALRGPFATHADATREPVRLKREPRIALRGMITGCDAARASGADVRAYLVSDATHCTLAGFALRCSSPTARGVVAHDGSFELSLPAIPLPTSGIVLRVAVDGFAPAQIDLPLPDPTIANPIHVPVSAGGSIAGRVTGDDPELCAGLVVLAGNADLDFIATRVEYDGSYRFEHLREGPWRLSIQRDEPETMYRMERSEARAPDVDVKDGVVTRKDLTWNVAPIAAVSGTIRFAGTTPRGIRVILRSKVEQQPPAGSFVFDKFEVTRTDVGPSGAFTLESNAAGAHTLRIEHEDGPSRRWIQLEHDVELGGGTTQVTLDFACGTVTAACSDAADDSAWMKATLADGTKVVIRAPIGPDGLLTLPLVPAGRYRFGAAQNGREIDVSGGATTTVELK